MTQPEAIFRTKLIAHLRKHSCHVWRIEPAVRGNFGLGDLFVVCLKTKWAGFVELKSLRGVLSDDQKEFQEDCRVCGINYIVCKHVEDIDELIPTSHSSRYNHVDDFYRKNPGFERSKK